MKCRFPVLPLFLRLWTNDTHIKYPRFEWLKALLPLLTAQMLQSNYSQINCHKLMYDIHQQLLIYLDFISLKVCICKE